MPKSTKPKKPAANPRSFYTAQPWKCHHHKDHSEILVYVEASGAWETIALIQPTAGASAETTAEFIAQLVNVNQQNQGALRDAMEALELCLEEDGLTFSSEQVAERALRERDQETRFGIGFSGVRRDASAAEGRNRGARHKLVDLRGFLAGRGTNV